LLAYLFPGKDSLSVVEYTELRTSIVVFNPEPYTAVLGKYLEHSSCLEVQRREPAGLLLHAHTCGEKPGFVGFLICYPQLVESCAKLPGVGKHIHRVPALQANLILPSRR
jgi:hypothetical protein